MIDALVVVSDRYRVIAGGAIDIGAEPELMTLAYAAFAPVNALVARGQAEETIRADMSDSWIVAAAVALISEAGRAVDRGDLAREDVAANVKRLLLEQLIRA